MLYGLPVELWVIIMRQLRPKSFGRLRATCLAFKQLLQHERTMRVALYPGIDLAFEQEQGIAVCLDVKHLEICDLPEGFPTLYVAPLIIRQRCKNVRTITWRTEILLTDDIIACWTADGGQLYQAERHAIWLKDFFVHPQFTAPSRYNLTKLHIKFGVIHVEEFGKSYIDFNIHDTDRDA
jgi:hypothetical protein